jgi:hypothetical protein
LIEFDESSQKKSKDMNIIEFRSDQTKIVSLAYNLAMENRSLVFTLFAPYWILNQTTLKLEYKLKGFENEINEIDNSMTDSPLFLKISCKAFDSQKKSISLRVMPPSSSSTGSTRPAADWSEAFFIDAVGNNGTVVSRSKETEKNYEIGVDIQLSSSGLTKIIKLSPYYLLINNTDQLLNVREVALSGAPESGHGLVIDPQSVVPFWPTNYHNKQNNCVSVRPLGDRSELSTNIGLSEPVWYNIKHSSVLTFKNNPYSETMAVECVPTDKIIRTVFKPYTYGMAPLLVLNCLNNVPVMIKQNDSRYVNRANGKSKQNPGNPNKKPGNT